MSYATLEQFKAAFDPSSAQGRAVAFGHADDRIQRWIDAASARMDSAFVEGGYVAPVDTSAAGVHQAALEALLAGRCLDLALREGGFGLDVAPDSFKVLPGRTDDWLERIKGVADFDSFGNPKRSFPSEHLPGLQRRGGGFRQVAGYPITTQTQGSHGLEVGDAFALSGGAYVLADLASDLLAQGIVVKVRSTSSFDTAYLSAGEISFPGHPYGSTPGERYLSPDTPGLLVEERPEDVVQVVLSVKSASAVILLSQAAVPG